MPRTLVVTNDFPPTIGGIQSYLRDFLATLDPEEVVVFASTQDQAAAAHWDAAAPYQVIRWPHRIMLPTPATARRMQQLIRELDIEVVWFGAAAPLALMGKAAKQAGARRVIASTHGHEVGWSMLPPGRVALRAIGRHADVVTYISAYTKRRLRRAFGPNPQWAHLPSAVSLQDFRPGGDQEAAKRHFGLDPSRPVIVCISRFVPRKGQDQLLRAMPRLSPNGAQLLLVGRGRYRAKLEKIAAQSFPGAVFWEARDTAELAQALQAADIFAMPARTRGWGLDVEGLGIVYLEAQAASVAVVAGNSGGAPETVTPQSGLVINGRKLGQLVAALETLLANPGLRREMGAAGRANVEQNWTWETMGGRLRALLRSGG
ncbi:GDP-mannose-dependent alpha-(1-6)-phosphatidylinositol monomannoside mannosyltransferase [Corynebacterium phocae]|uniref:GDP-mannose-dependent alpha-(1-6)-phosphatidylinositol monomannoside mannosyltransferase n=1 Tax=Corynebacterium phocae TaxID=161895 RepID=A0A1L7D274_9CORY|nr:glycosyltransferase family 4 protein [Corynebacterium phocae]APT92208.1 GDP-mannose-dependent alpha-(1-6)-phosphatidylinositol monomannoside mannosyltransferase [Corynebacterium phocae]KAA8725788.1 glycosyltransferase family 4 protein [Corynebacterium phocae]